ncbi:major facilitator superfamily domain-containing protein [Zalerion maritima]|uniref:Major facilitator superfamily domain-containing protein n=1 Tax=Zalerion maritima TaxID=339359 RepID=A0AAD5WUE3_9PEZI|nr:major facilitator superfamily domain-containing protein [Zalerion maritima]
MPPPNNPLTEMAREDRRDSMEDTLRDTENPAPLSPVVISGFRRVALMVIDWLAASLLVGFMFSILDTSIVSTALVRIAQELGDFGNAPWVVLSYLLTYMGFAIGFAKFSDVLGRGTMVFVAWLLFAMFSVGCALSKTMLQLIVFRAIQGIGGSGLYSLCQISLVELVPANPSLIGALVGCTLAISFVLGPILGGVISNFIGWQYIFWINVPFGALAMLLVPAFWPKERRRDVVLGLRRMDWLGIVLLLAGSVLLIVGLQEGGSFFRSWSHSLVTTSLTVATVAWIGFWSWELLIGLRLVAKLDVEPAFPIRLAAKRVYVAALLQTLFTGFPYIGLTIVLPERFQIVDGDSSLMAGVKLLPMLAACALGSFIAGAMSKKTNLTSLTLIFASALQLAGLALFSTISPVPDIEAILEQPPDGDRPLEPGDPVAVRDGNDGKPLFAEPLQVRETPRIMYFFQFLFGLGVGLSLAAASMITSIQAGNHDHASAHGAVAQARVFGGALGIISCNIILDYHLRKFVVPVLPKGTTEAFMKGPLEQLNKLTPTNKEWMRVVYTSAFGTMIKGMLYVGVACLVASFFAWEKNPADTIAAIRRHKLSIGTTSGNSGNEEEEAEEDEERPPSTTGRQRRLDHQDLHTSQQQHVQHLGRRNIDVGHSQRVNSPDYVPTLATSIPGASIEMDQFSLRSSRYAPSRTRVGTRSTTDDYGIDDDDDDDAAVHYRRFSLSTTERI